MTDRRVALLFGDRIAQARLTEALRGFASLAMIETSSDLEAALLVQSPICATVIFFAPSHQAEALRAAERLHAACPDHPVIGYVDPRTLNSRFILETGKADLADLVLRDIDDSRAVLLRVLQNAEQRSIATRVVEEMCDGLPRHARMTLQFIARHLREREADPAEQARAADGDHAIPAAGAQVGVRVHEGREEVPHEGHEGTRISRAFWFSFGVTVANGGWR